MRKPDLDIGGLWSRCAQENQFLGYWGFTPSSKEGNGCIKSHVPFSSVHFRNQVLPHRKAWDNYVGLNILKLLKGPDEHVPVTSVACHE